METSLDLIHREALSFPFGQTRQVSLDRRHLRSRVIPRPRSGGHLFDLGIFTHSHRSLEHLQPAPLPVRTGLFSNPVSAVPLRMYAILPKVVGIDSGE